jgi:hypothetical protein
LPWKPSQYRSEYCLKEPQLRMGPGMEPRRASTKHTEEREGEWKNKVEGEGRDNCTITTISKTHPVPRLMYTHEGTRSLALHWCVCVCGLTCEVSGLISGCTAPLDERAQGCH